MMKPTSYQKHFIALWRVRTIIHLRDLAAVSTSGLEWIADGGGGTLVRRP